MLIINIGDDFGFKFGFGVHGVAKCISGARSRLRGGFSSVTRRVGIFYSWVWARVVTLGLGLGVTERGWPIILVG